MTAGRSIAVILVAILAGCSSPPEIDSFITFNIIRSVDFPIANSASTGVDTGVQVHGSIDTTEYNRDESSAYLLHASRVGKISIRSSDPGFTLNNLAYARVLIGADTVGYGNIFVGSEDTVAMTGIDITPLMRDTSFAATLQFNLKTAPTQPVTLTATLTIIHTADHTPLIQ